MLERSKVLPKKIRGVKILVWLFYSRLLVRNLKHSPICLCFSWHIPRPMASLRSQWFLFYWPLELSGVWNPCLHTPMTTNVKTVPTLDSIVTLKTCNMVLWERTGCSFGPVTGPRWYLTNTPFTLDKKPTNTHTHLTFVFSRTLYNRHSLAGQMTLQSSGVFIGSISDQQW